MPTTEEKILEVLAEIKMLSNPSRPIQKLIKLVPELSTPSLLSQALDITAEISNSAACAVVLSKLSHQLGNDQIFKALGIARKIRQKKSRTYSLRVLMSQVTDDLIPEILTIARQLISDDNYCDCADLLIAVIPQVPPESLQEILEITYKIDNNKVREFRIKALSELNLKISENFLDTCNNDILYENWRKEPEVWKNLTAIKYDEYKHQKINYSWNLDNWIQNLAVWQAIGHEAIDHVFCDVPRTRAKVLAILYYCFEQGKQQEYIFEKLLKAVEEIPVKSCKIRTFIDWIPYLSNQNAIIVLNKTVLLLEEIFEEINRYTEKINNPSQLRDTFNISEIKKLKNQLHIITVSELLNKILKLVDCTDSFLFPFPRWWEPSMIEGLPPVLISQPHLISIAGELTRGSQSGDNNNTEAIFPINSLVRYPNLDCPDKVLLNQRFSLIVELLIEQPEDQPEVKALMVEDKTDLTPEIEVVLSASGFDIEGSNTQIIQVERDDESNVRFVLIPSKLGQHKIKVQFYQNGKPIGKAVRNILVSEQSVTTEVPQPDQPTELELNNGKIPPQDLELFIQLDDDDHTLSFFLHSVKEEIGYRRTKVGKVTLKGSPLEKMQSIYEKMNQYAKTKPTKKEGEILAEKRIADVGNYLWKDLIPYELKQEYWKFKDRVKSLMINSDEPWIPWEMLKPFRVNDENVREDDLFWCQQFSVSRWLSGAGTIGEFDIKTVRPMAPRQENLPSLKDEMTFLEQLSSLRPNINSLAAFNTPTQVLDSLENEDLSIIHFACHGSFDSISPNNSSIELSDGLLYPSDIQVRFGGKRQRPLIFINACHGARTEFGFTGLGGWADCLLDAHAGAFIGAMWEVTDRLSLQFTKTFYTALIQENKTIADAFRQAREEIRQMAPYNSTWLAYTLYADPEGRVKP